MGYPHLTTECHEHWRTITVCGSMRFYEVMLKFAAKLTLDGWIVLMPFCVVEEAAQGGCIKANLDALHRRKIDLSRSILVVTDDAGYIGDSTRSEINYALVHRKSVAYATEADL
jgi:hypothetical protein